MERYRVQPDQVIRLAEWNPADTSAFAGKKRDGRAYQKQLVKRLEALQELLYAEGRHKLVIVLQGMDTSGKDGTIRHVFDGVNPQGVGVASFKQPTAEELGHDYLWRVHKQTPGQGKIVIFNRSHYEDVLVVRVHGLVTPEIWQRRYDHINHFEGLLADEGTTVLKFFLHISREEQQARLQARLDEPEKRWKFSRADLAERKLWSQYVHTYEDVLNKTSTVHAPWYIVPADRKWYRNLVIGQIIVKALEGLQMRYPEPETALDDIVIE